MKLELTIQEAYLILKLVSHSTYFYKEDDNAIRVVEKLNALFNEGGFRETR